MSWKKKKHHREEKKEKMERFSLEGQIRSDAREERARKRLEPANTGNNTPNEQDRMTIKIYGTEKNRRESRHSAMSTAKKKKNRVNGCIRGRKKMCVLNLLCLQKRGEERKGELGGRRGTAGDNGLSTK